MAVKYVLTPEGYGFEVGTHDESPVSIDIEIRYQQRREG